MEKAKCIESKEEMEIVRAKEKAKEVEKLALDIVAVVLVGVATTGG